MNINLIVHEKLSLINPQVEQAKEMFKLIDENRNFLNQFITFAQHKDSLDRVKSFLHEIASFNFGGQKFNLIIQYEGQLAGVIGFHKIDRIHARAEIGYWIGEKFQGKGIMSNAIPKFLQYGFEALAVNKVELHTMTSHTRNIKLVEGLGFKQEGILREHYFMHDTFQDAIMYRMLRSEFLEKDQELST